MLKPGVDMRSASRAAEFSAVSRLMPEEGEADDAMGDVLAAARPLLLERGDLVNADGDGKTSDNRKSWSFVRLQKRSWKAREFQPLF